MPEAWPVTLPTAPLIDGYHEEAPNDILRTSMDAGPPKQRRRSTAGVRRLSVGFALTTAQVAVLDQFFVDTLNGGVDPFTWTHPRTGSATTFRFAGEPPSYEPWSDDGWIARATLEILP